MHCFRIVFLRNTEKNKEYNLDIHVEDLDTVISLSPNKLLHFFVPQFLHLLVLNDYSLHSYDLFFLGQNKVCMYGKLSQIFAKENIQNVFYEVSVNMQIG